MKILAFTILLLLALAVSPPAASEDPLVRVEVIVFAHAAGQSDQWPAVEAPDFSALIDPRDRTRLAAWTARPAAEADPASEAPPGDSPDAETPDSMTREPGLEPVADRKPASAPISAPLGDVEPDWPNLLIHEPVLTASMERARTRLESSSDYEVLSVTSWLQPLAREISSPAVRIRDDTPIRVVWLDLPRLDVEFRDRITGPALLPRSQFRLDGSVRVRQRQFRHVDLDLVWSEPIGRGSDALTLDNRRLLVHRLRQSRPVQLDRVEYFDSDWLGVLVRIQHWEAPARESGRTTPSEIR